MEKGFIEYKNDKIPFVIKDYCMELFTDDALRNVLQHSKNRELTILKYYFR